jgi:hypothetical protein
MELAYAFFAEAAQITPDGRVNVLGGDLRSWQGKFPLVVPSVAFVATIVLEDHEREATHHFLAQIVQPDGLALEPRLETEFKAPPPVNPELKAAATILVRIMGMTFPMPGIYSVHISVDGRELKRLRLLLTEIQEQPNLASAQQKANAT